MKNILKSLFVAVVAIMAISCENNAVEDGRLATPEFNYNVTDNTVLVTWGAVEGAAYYEITLVNVATEKTEKLVHRFEDLEFDTEYTINLQAIAADASKRSEVASKNFTIGKRTPPAYREWFPKNSAPAVAISNNGRYVIGGGGMNGFVLDLSTDKMVEYTGYQFYDVADDGTAVGADHTSNTDGDAAILVGDQMVAIDLSSIASKYGMSCATSVTPDGEYVVGWFWEYDETSYYFREYGQVVPFCYDILEDRVTVPPVGERLYNESYATAIKAVDPDRCLLGYEEMNGIRSIIWEDEYTPYEYAYFEYNEEYEPVFSIGDTQNLFSPSGRYVYGYATDYATGFESTLPGVYDRDTDEVYTFNGGYVSAMNDDGYVFINDQPYYLGTTTYVVDINKGEPYINVELEEWLFDEFGVDIASFEPSTDETPGDNLYLEGINTIAVSEDSTVMVGITNTVQGWMTFVIDLNGTPAE